MSQNDRIGQNEPNSLSTMDQKSAITLEQTNVPVSKSGKQMEAGEKSLMALTTENSALPSISPPKRTLLQTIGRKVVKFGKFVGPGFMVSVAYIDPGMKTFPLRMCSTF
jgi:hypothetical protein